MLYDMCMNIVTLHCTFKVNMPPYPGTGGIEEISKLIREIFRENKARI